MRAALSLSQMSGGDWVIGYAQYEGEVFAFCNIGIAGRTGNDFPNRWVGDALYRFGKNGSTVDEPMIQSMVTGVVTTHVFWRGRDRTPYTNAGVSIADSVGGEKPPPGERVVDSLGVTRSSGYQRSG